MDEDCRCFQLFNYSTFLTHTIPRIITDRLRDKESKKRFEDFAHRHSLPTTLPKRRAYVEGPEDEVISHSSVLLEHDFDTLRNLDDVDEEGF